MADLEQIAFGGDPVAIEAAKQEARREFWKQALTIASDIVRYRFG
jgi:hypothetical protein